MFGNQCVVRWKITMQSGWSNERTSEWSSDSEYEYPWHRNSWRPLWSPFFHRASQSIRGIPNIDRDVREFAVMMLGMRQSRRRCSLCEITFDSCSGILCCARSLYRFTRNSLNRWYNLPLTYIFSEPLNSNPNFFLEHPIEIFLLYSCYTKYFPKVFPITT